VLARLATRSAKPDGQYYVSPQDVLDFVSKHQVHDLPGELPTLTSCRLSMALGLVGYL